MLSDAQLIPITEAYEEIFALYAHRQTISGRPGLGLVASTEDSVTLTVSVPKRCAASTHASTSSTGKRHKKTKPAPVAEELTRSATVSQDVHALRHRSGDTGSGVWRLSISLATLLLDSFVNLPAPSALLSSSRSPESLNVLELGSGTGFLGIVLRSFVNRWIWTDQHDNLPLIAKNLRKNDLDPSNESVIELDWLDPPRDVTRWLAQALATPAVRSPGSASSSQDTETNEGIDLIIACDCIYNEHLAKPLARTIDALVAAQPAHYRQHETKVLVASELRDPDPLETFLGEWLELGWTVERWPALTDGVLWVGTKKPQIGESGRHEGM